MWVESDSHEVQPTNVVQRVGGRVESRISFSESTRDCRVDLKIDLRRIFQIRKFRYEINGLNLWFLLILIHF